MPQRKVTMRHPRVENSITVPESAVASRIASGWHVIDTPPKPAPAVEPAHDDAEEASDKPAARRGRRFTEPTTEEF